jgi:hypothetical protein
MHLNFRTHKMNPAFVESKFSSDPPSPESFVNIFLPVIREKVVNGKSVSQAVDSLIKVLNVERYCRDMLPLSWKPI